MIPSLETDRLILRAPCESDLDAYYGFYKNTDVAVGKYRQRTSLKDIQAILESDIAHWSKGFGVWMLTLANGEVIGGAGLCHPDDWPSHELTWWLMPDHRGNGYATEASRAVIEFGYGTLGWPVVETHMRDENKAARRLATRLGGQAIRRDIFPDGVARDVFALPRDPALLDTDNDGSVEAYA